MSYLVFNAIYCWLDCKPARAALAIFSSLKSLEEAIVAKICCFSLSVNSLDKLFIELLNVDFIWLVPFANSLVPELSVLLPSANLLVPSSNFPKPELIVSN